MGLRAHTGAPPNVTYDAALGIHLTSDTSAMPRPPVAGVGEIRERLESPSFRALFLPSLIAVLIAVAALVWFLSPKITFNGRIAVKVFGSVISVFGVLLTTTELLVPLRAKLKEIAFRAGRRVRGSYLWEFYYAGGIRIVLGGLVVIGMLLLFAMLQWPVGISLRSWFAEQQLNWLYAVIVIGIFALSIFVFSSFETIDRVLYSVVTAVIFVPRLLFWIIMWTADRICRRTENVASCRYVGGVLTIAGILLLMLV